MSPQSGGRLSRRVTAMLCVLVAFLLLACEDEPSSDGRITSVSCAEELKVLRRSAVHANSGLRNALPELERLFRAALQGERRASAGTNRNLPIEGVFEAAMETLRANQADLGKGLSRTRTCRD